MLSTVTLPVRLAGETREVEFTGRPEGMFWHGCEVAAKIGAGTKAHRTTLVAVRFESVEAARKARWAARDMVETEAGVFCVKKSATVRNRPAQVVGWAEDYRGTATATRQTYYGSF